MGRPSLQLQKALYGFVVPKTKAIDDALAKIREGVGPPTSLPRDVIVADALLPSSGDPPEYILSFHFDRVHGSAFKKRRSFVMGHLHFSSAPDRAFLDKPTALRRRGRTVEWLGKILDSVFGNDTPVLCYSELSSGPGFPLPTSVDAAQLVVPPIETGSGDGTLQLVGAEYRSQKPPRPGALFEVRWSKEQAGNLAFNIGYAGRWEIGVRNPWKKLLTDATRQLKSLR